MRSHRAILRLIAENGLDPKIPYVAGKNGTLVPKPSKSTPAPVEHVFLNDEVKDLVEAPTEVETPAVDLPIEVTEPEIVVPTTVAEPEPVVEVELVISKTVPPEPFVDPEVFPAETVVEPVPEVETKKKTQFIPKKKKFTESQNS